MGAHRGVVMRKELAEVNRRAPGQGCRVNSISFLLAVWSVVMVARGCRATSKRWIGRPNARCSAPGTITACRCAQCRDQLGDRGMKNLCWRGPPGNVIAMIARR